MMIAHYLPPKRLFYERHEILHYYSDKPVTALH